eukprot:1338731-Amphidinium_carterae.1
MLDEGVLTKKTRVSKVHCHTKAEQQRAILCVLSPMHRRDHTVNICDACLACHRYDISRGAL